MGECTNSACERITHTFASAMHGMTKLTSSSTIVLSASFNISTSSPSCWYVVVAGSYVCVRVCVCVCVCVCCIYVGCADVCTRKRNTVVTTTYQISRARKHGRRSVVRMPARAFGRRFLWRLVWWRPCD